MKVRPHLTQRFDGRQAELSKVLVDGCLFEECYAKRKGGGVAHKNGNMSVVNSVFYGNRAGGENIEHGESIRLGKCVARVGSDGDAKDGWFNAYDRVQVG